MIEGVTIHGQGLYYIDDNLGVPDKRVTSMKAFVGYDDIPPIRIMVFLTKEARDIAMRLISENGPFVYGPLLKPMDINPEPKTEL